MRLVFATLLALLAPALAVAEALPGSIVCSPRHVAAGRCTDAQIGAIVVVTGRSTLYVDMDDSDRDLLAVLVCESASVANISVTGTLAVDATARTLTISEGGLEALDPLLLPPPIDTVSDMRLAISGSTSNDTAGYYLDGVESITDTVITLASGYEHQLTDETSTASVTISFGCGQFFQAWGFEMFRGAYNGLLLRDELQDTIDAHAEPTEGDIGG